MTLYVMNHLDVKPHMYLDAVDVHVRNVYARKILSAVNKHGITIVSQSVRNSAMDVNHAYLTVKERTVEKTDVVEIAEHARKMKNAIQESVFVNLKNAILFAVLKVKHVLKINAVNLIALIKYAVQMDAVDNAESVQMALYAIKTASANHCPNLNWTLTFRKFQK